MDTGTGIEDNTLLIFSDSDMSDGDIGITIFAGQMDEMDDAEVDGTRADGIDSNGIGEPMDEVEDADVHDTRVDGTDSNGTDSNGIGEPVGNVRTKWTR